MSTEQKRRRTTTKAKPEAPSTTSASEEDTIPLSQLTKHLADALKASKAVKPIRSNGPAIKKAHQLANNLLKALPVDVTIQAIEYDSHKASLDKGIKALEKDIKRDWHDGYYEQGEIMSEITAQILGWLPDLWRLMAEEDADLHLIKQSLALCSDTVRSIENCHSRAEYRDMDFEIEVTDSSGKKIYSGTYAYIGHTLSWMWKELLVYSASQNGPTKTILADIKRFKITDDVFGLIRQGGKEKGTSGYTFWDAHWSESMKNSAAKLCEVRP